MKRIEHRLPGYVAYCLWSYDLSSIDIRQDWRLIVTQVLNYGDWRGVQWLFKTYPETKIKEVVSHPTRGLWLKQVLNFWCLMLKVHLPKRVRERAIFHIEPRF